MFVEHDHVFSHRLYDVDLVYLWMFKGGVSTPFGEFMYMLPLNVSAENVDLDLRILHHSLPYYTQLCEVIRGENPLISVPMITVMISC
jgi:hypothetical protein